MKKKLTFLLALLLTTTLNAQVTIGSGQPPAAGALLDLKQETTTTGGLGMPRVTLTNLTPITPAQLSASIGNTGNWDLTEHIGLVVYNVTKNGNVCLGLHVWDGTNWVAIGSSSRPDIIMTDRDGNAYNGRWFSSGDACDPAAVGVYWTTSNLYTTKDANGNAFTPGTVWLNPGKYNDSGLIPINSTADFTGTVTYGEGASAATVTNQTLSMVDFAQKFGLFYNWEQAKLACPGGWHLPTGAEWNALFDLYGGRAVVGDALRANNNFYQANDSGSPWQWGTPTVLSGFNALPAGEMNGGYFSTAAAWSIADAHESNIILDGSPSINGSTHGPLYPLSVRCVKD